VNRSTRFLLLTAFGTMTLAALVIWADGERRGWRDQELPRLQTLAARLDLTDLALWSEARYARHPSQADLFSAFQDFPAAPEHFPAGSITGPPPGLRGPLEKPEPGRRGP
jgi:hypothetical protein